jgi:hypothetical protein
VRRGAPIHRGREAEPRGATRDEGELPVEALLGRERRELAPHAEAIEHAGEDGGDGVVLVEPLHRMRSSSADPAFRRIVRSDPHTSARIP